MEPDENTPAGPEAPAVYTTPDELKDNPAWQPFLELLPESLHNQIKPALRDWDKNVNTRFQEIHQEYEPFKAYQDNGITPDVINKALGFVQQLEENPAEIWQQIGDYYNLTPQQVETLRQVSPELTDDSQEDYESQPNYQDPRYDELREVVENMAGILVGENEAKEQAAADADYAAELKVAHEEHGAFDEQYVSVIASQNGGDLNAAIAQYQSIVETAMTEKNRPPAPVVLGSSASLPAEGLDVGKLDSKSTKNLVADILAKAAQNR